MQQSPVFEVKLRVPVEVKKWLASRAKANCRSVNGEALAILLAAKKVETTMVCNKGE